MISSATIMDKIYHETVADPTAAEIEKYKKDWKVEGFPRMEVRDRKTTGMEPGDPTYQPEPEQALWAAVIGQALRDREGLAGASKNRCECGCGKTAQACAQRWLASRDFADTCEGLGLHVGYVRKLVAA